MLYSISRVRVSTMEKRDQGDYGLSPKFVGKIKWSFCIVMKTLTRKLPSFKLMSRYKDTNLSSTSSFKNVITGNPTNVCWKHNSIHQTITSHFHLHKERSLLFLFFQTLGSLLPQENKIYQVKQIMGREIHSWKL